MSKRVDKTESSFVKFLKAPVRILIKARDAYVRSMTSCSARLSHGGGAAGFGLPTGHFHVNTGPSRSFSLDSFVRSNGDEDFRELIRAASARAGGGSSGKTMMMVRGSSPFDLQRNYSVGIGRIDEDRPCEFGREDGWWLQTSKSCIVRKKGSGVYNYYKQDKGS